MRNGTLKWVVSQTQALVKVENRWVRDAAGRNLKKQNGMICQQMIAASKGPCRRKYRGVSRSRLALEARESDHEGQDARVFAGGVQFEVVERHGDEVIKVLLKAV